MSPKSQAIHLAKSPHAAVLVTWCGFEEKRTRGKLSVSPMCRWDGGDIVRVPPFTCTYCLGRIIEELARLKAILPATNPLLEQAREHTMGLGCGDNSCASKRRGGVGTNGGCRCDLPALRRAASAWASYAKLLEGAL